MTAERSSFDPSSFDFGPQRTLRPLPDESPEWFFGNYMLEQAERYATEQAISLHREYLLIWYRMLDAYYRALDIGRVQTDDELWITIWKILRLGICAAKGALDATLAGYYVGAFGDLRQMTEYFFGINHLVQNPSTVSRYYLTEEGEQPQRLPSAGQRIAEVITALEPNGAHANPSFLEYATLVRKSYRRMSDGHHLDGLALVQTGSHEDRGYYLGAGYHESLAKEALYHGTLLTGTLALSAASFLREQLTNGDQLIAEIGAAMDAALHQLAPIQEESGDEAADESGGVANA